MTILNDIAETICIARVLRYDGTTLEKAGFIGIAFCILLSCLIIIKVREDDEPIYLLWLIATGTAIVFIVVFIFVKTINKEVHTYEVIFNDEIPFTEVMNKYDLIERRGNIFTIKERTFEINNDKNKQ